MNETSDLFPWIERAEEDYLLSVSALKRKRPLIYGATFHAQQCAEKYLKAILTFQQAPFPRTHDLAALGVLCQQNGIILPISDDAWNVCQPMRLKYVIRVCSLLQKKRRTRYKLREISVNLPLYGQFRAVRRNPTPGGARSIA